MKIPLPSDLHRAAERLPLNQRLVVTGILVGATTGLAVYCFHALLAACDGLRGAALNAALPPVASAALRIILPAAGGLFAGVLSTRWCPEASGNGVEQVIEAVHHRQSRIPGRTAFFKSVASAATIGTGGSTGLEGPVVQIGASLGSWLGRFLDAPERDLPVFVAAGAVGGLSAAIGTPLAGVFFTMEIVLMNFANEAFPAVVVSSAVGAAVARSLLSGESLAVPVAYEWSGALQMAMLGSVGLLLSPLGRLCAAAMRKVPGLFKALPVPEWARPGVGGAVVGALSLAAARASGTGRDVIGDALSGRFSGWQAAVYAPFKIVATAVTIGSGGSGGALMPVLAAGAAAGSALGSGVAVAGVSAATPGAWAVVGMSAVFTSAFSAPATGIVLGLELTRDYGLLPPLMIACAAAHLASRRVAPQPPAIS